MPHSLRDTTHLARQRGRVISTGITRCDAMSLSVDVPMAEWPETAGSSQGVEIQTSIFPSHHYIYIAIDTNVLISHLELVKKVYLRLREVSTAKAKRKTSNGVAAQRDIDDQSDVCLLLPCVVLDGEHCDL